MAESILEAEYLRGARKGLEQGFAQGETRGRMLAQREALIGLLRKKFGSSADEAAIERITAAEDLELLGEWLEAAGLARSWKQFAKAANWTQPS